MVVVRRFIAANNWSCASLSSCDEFQLFALNFLVVSKINDYQTLKKRKIYTERQALRMIIRSKKETRLEDTYKTRKPLMRKSLLTLNMFGKFVVAQKRTPNQEVFQETSSSSYNLSSNIYTNNKASKKDAPFKNVYKKSLTFLYTNADQFVNKRDDLIMFIANDSPDVILITEIIPKKQMNPITQALLNIDGYTCVLNFDPNDQNLGASGIRGVIIYSKKALEVIEVEFKIDGFQDHAWIEIPSKNGESILCGCIYRSPSYDSDSKKCLEITKKVIATDSIRISSQHEPINGRRF